MQITINIEKNHLVIFLAALVIIAGIGMVTALDTTKGWHDLSQIRVTSNFDMDAYKIINLDTPSQDTDAANKYYVDRELEWNNLKNKLPNDFKDGVDNECSWSGTLGGACTTCYWDDWCCESGTALSCTNGKLAVTSCCTGCCPSG